MVAISEAVQRYKADQHCRYQPLFHGMWCKEKDERETERERDDREREGTTVEREMMMMME